jgi:hypothetical protein
MSQTYSPDLEIQPRTGLHIALWGGQVLLAALYGAAGFTKLTGSMAELPSMIPWTADVPRRSSASSARASCSDAIGLLLPSIFRIQPKLSASPRPGSPR